MAKRKPDHRPEDQPRQETVNERNARYNSEREAKEAERVRRRRFGHWVEGEELTIGQLLNLLKMIESQWQSERPDEELIRHWSCVMQYSPGWDELRHHIEVRGEDVTSESVWEVNKELRPLAGKGADDVNRLKLTEAVRLLSTTPEPAIGIAPVICCKVDVVQFVAPGGHRKNQGAFERLHRDGIIGRWERSGTKVAVWMANPADQERLRRTVEEKTRKSRKR